MEKLAERISEQLKTQRQHAVYEHDLTRFWPLPDPEREAKIAHFARERGWRLRFYKEGLCAIFDKRPPKGRQSVSPAIKTIELRPFGDGWKALETPGVEPYFIGNRAKEEALDYAKRRQRSNHRPILIFDSDGMLIDVICPAVRP